MMEVMKASLYDNSNKRNDNEWCHYWYDHKRSEWDALFHWVWISNWPVIQIEFLVKRRDIIYGQEDDEEHNG